jgi:hypothetical protein
LVLEALLNAAIALLKLGVLGEEEMHLAAKLDFTGITDDVARAPAAITPRRVGI